jgi:NTE family protein
MGYPERGADKGLRKVAVGCQGGGMHAAFEVGVLTEILKDVEQKRFELVGLSGTSAGALCTLMAWYGLAPKKNGSPGSAGEAIDNLNRVWNDFTAETGAENALNLFSYYAFRMQEAEMPLGLNAPVFALNPFSVLSSAVTALLPKLGIREEYINLERMLAEACPEFDRVDWSRVNTRLLVGASEVINGFETVFDSDVNKGLQAEGVRRWCKRLPLTLRGVAASGTLPDFCEAVRIDGGSYWDGLYSQNPPVREFLSGVSVAQTPDELWIVRINPQQWPEEPKSKGDILDRKNELMGNMSLNKELDFVLTVNDLIANHGEPIAKNYKPVTVRTIKMKEKTADALRYSSKFDRRREFTNRLRKEGREVARDWLDRWPDVGCYPDDAAYRPRR